ncbi:MAG TPA: RNA-binding domain-containing protein [Nitrososphaera sp.]|jgi:RNA binding exosome subunit
MQEQPRFSAAEVDLVLHATEAADRVLRSISDSLQILPERFSRTPAEGHFKNKILLLKANLSSQEAAALASRLTSLLNSSDRDELSTNLVRYLDEKGSLYLRIDKQRLCQGKVSLSESDSIRIRFRPVKRYRPAGSFDSYRGLLSSIE